MRKQREGANKNTEEGSGTVLVVGVVAVLLVLAIAVTSLVQAQAAAGRARLAADLAALGGATALSSMIAPGLPCQVAQHVAQANGAEIGSCAVDGEDVVVQAYVSVRLLGITRQAQGTARAGPVSPG